MKKFSKVLSFVLVLLMVLTALPVSAMAEGMRNFSLNGIREWITGLGDGFSRPVFVDPDKYPEQTLTVDTGDGLTVTVDAPEGALPKNTTMNVVRVTDIDAVQAAVDQSADVSGTVLTAVDITFYNKSGKEIQPKKDVLVTISSAVFDGRRDICVVHIDSDANGLRSGSGKNAELVNSSAVTGSAVTFSARSFSVYAVIGDGTSEQRLLTINFYDKDGTTLINKQVIRMDQIPTMQSNNSIIVYDPGVPSLASNEAFIGWDTTVAGGSYVQGLTKLSVDDITDYIVANYQSWQNGHELNYIAQVYQVVFVFYCDQYGAVYKSEPHAVGEDFTYDTSYVPDGPSDTTVGLVGWVEYKDTTYVEKPGEKAGDGTSTDYMIPDYTSAAPSEAAGRVPGGNGTINSELILFPYITSGHWVTFDNNIENNASDLDKDTKASYTSPRFVSDNGYLTAPTVPTRPGYTFGGWYTQSTGGSEFNFATTTVSSDMVLYARWTPGTASYTIIFWTQKNTDEVGLADSAKKYDYYAPKNENVVVSGTAQSGSTITLQSSNSGKTAYNRLGRNSEYYSGNSNNGELGYYFKLNTTLTQTSAMIKGDGTTVFNVYYDRATITINFYQSYNNGSYSNRMYTFTGLYQHALPSDFAQVGGYPDPQSTYYTTYTWFMYDKNVSKTYLLSLGTAPTCFTSFVECSETWNIHRDSVSSSGTTRPLYYYTQDLDGVYRQFRVDSLAYDSNASQNIGGKEYYGFTGVGYNLRGNSMTNSYYTTFEAAEEAVISIVGNTISSNGCYIYYQRNSWDFDYYSNGVTYKAATMYNNGNKIFYQADITGFADFVPTNAPEGKYFTGWYSDPACTQKYTFTGVEGTMPNSNVMVFAGWADEYYRIVFKADTGDITGNTVVVSGTNQTLSFTMKNGDKIGGTALSQIETLIPGYTFGGWYYDEACTQQFNFGTVITAHLPGMDMTYKDAPDSQRTGTYTYNTKDDNDQLTLKNVTWHDQGSANAGVRGKLVLYALWRQKIAGAAGISVIYDAVEGQGIIRSPYPEQVVKPDPLLYTDGAVAFGRYAATPIDSEGNDDPNRIFLYWEIRDENGNVLYKVYPGQPFPVNIEWAVETDSYTITWRYMKADGSGMTSNTTTVAEGMMPTHVDPPTYNNNGTYMLFTGWTPELTAAYEDAVYVAQYEAGEVAIHTVTFDANGGNFGSGITTNTQPVVHGAYATAPTTINPPSGKRFVGWYMNGGTTLMTSDEVNVTPITAATTFTAQYEDAGYTVTFYANNGTFGSSGTTTTTVVRENVAAGTRISNLFPASDPTNSNKYNDGNKDYDLFFYGWFTAANGGTQITTQTVTGDTAVYAHWATQIYKRQNISSFVDGDYYCFDHASGSYTVTNGNPGSYMTSTYGSTVGTNQKWRAVSASAGGFYLVNTINGTDYYMTQSSSSPYYGITTTGQSSALRISLTTADNSGTYYTYYLKDLNFTSSEYLYFDNYDDYYYGPYIWSTSYATALKVYHLVVEDRGDGTGSKSVDAVNDVKLPAYDERDFVAPAPETESGKTVTMRDAAQYTLYTGDLVEGDYLLVYNGAAMNTTLSSNRLQYDEVTITDNTIQTDNAAIVWHLALNNNYWTLYNASVGQYAGAGTSNNRMRLSATVTDYFRYSVTKSGNTFDFQDQGLNRYLRRNGTYGFAAYASNTGGPLSLYKKVDSVTSYTVTYMSNGVQVGQQTVTGSTTLPTSVNNAPTGYTLIGWSTTEIADTTTQPTTNYYAKGTSYTPSGDVTLYAVFSYTQGGAETTVYQLVTSTQSDWTGDYVISYGKTSSMYVLKGCSTNETSIESTTYAKTLSAAGITLTDNKLYNVDDIYAFHAAETSTSGYSGYYYFENLSTVGYLTMYRATDWWGDYTGDSQLYNYTTLYPDGLWQLTYESAGNVKMYVYTASNHNYPYVSFSSSSNCFESGNSGTNVSQIYLWKKTTETSGETHYTTGETTYTVNAVVSGGHGSIQAPASVSGVAANGTATFTAVPDAGYEVDTVTVTSGTATASHNGNTITVSGVQSNATVTVTFKLSTTTNYTVTYMANGQVYDTDTVADGTTINLPSTAPAVTGYNFVGWSSSQIADTDTEPSFYAKGASYTVHGNTTFYAVYSIVEGGTGTTSYVLVENALDDWTGNYVITYGTSSSMYVMTGVSVTSNNTDIESVANSTAFASTGIVRSGNQLTNVANDYVFTMAKHGSYYSVQSVSTGTYIGETTGGYFGGYTTYTATYCDWTPGTGTNASGMASGYTAGSYDYLGFSTGSNYFWTGSSINESIRLWKETNDGTTHWTTDPETGTMHTVTVNYVLPAGYSLPAGSSNPVVISVDEGDPYSIESPVIPGLTASQAVVSGTMDNQNVTVTVTYTENATYTVTIHYINGDTGIEFMTTTETLADGVSYSYDSPVMPGYTPDVQVVSGTINGANVTVTVTYTADSGASDKTYTITLYAVYGPVNKTGKTHIYWYSNDDAASEFSGGDRHIDNELDINEATNIPTPTDFSITTITNDKGVVDEQVGLVWEDHVFLGWARLEHSNYYPNGKAEPQLNEDDLFLKWTGSGYKAQNAGGAWVDVTQVAADEMQPYHDMYAVWASVFYVYHSGTNEVERIVASSKAGTYDLTANLPEGTLYGGYYHSYEGMGQSFNIKTLGWADVTSENLSRGICRQTTVGNAVAKDANGRAYTAANVASITWNWNESYNTDTLDSNNMAKAADAPGNAIRPVAGETYYIKEVPASKYLQPYLHYTYKLDGPNGTPGTVTKIWLISDVDDLNYNQAGFVLMDTSNGATNVVNSLTITTSGGTSTTTRLTAQQLFGVNKGYLSYRSYTPAGLNHTRVRNYWVTPDGLLVTGTNIRTLGQTGTVAHIHQQAQTVLTGVASTIGQYTPAD